MWAMIGSGPSSQSDPPAARTNASVFDVNDTEWQPYHPYQPAWGPSRTTATMLLPDGNLPSPPSEFKNQEDPACACQKTLINHLHQLHTVQHRHHGRPLPLDTTLSRTRQVLLISEDTLACQPCRLDTGVLALIVRLLRAVFSWMKKSGYHLQRIATRQQQQQQQQEGQETPPVCFGDWEVVGEDGHLVRALLMGRMLSSGICRVNVLRARLDEVSQVMAGVQGVRYQQLVHVHELQRALQGLTGSLRELVQFVRLSMHA